MKLDTIMLAAAILTAVLFVATLLLLVLPS